MHDYRIIYTMKLLDTINVDKLFYETDNWSQRNYNIFKKDAWKLFLESLKGVERLVAVL